ncbi:MAG: transposon-transfer assisting family protein [Oscillospiraceae bacterium]|nr:transposon-transfer assisting family protein [Oscillospiraceae bacterium]
MNTFKFSAEEINLMCIYDTTNRVKLISEIKTSLTDVSDPELIEIMETVIDKLEHTTDEEYADMSFFPTSEFDEYEN